MEEKGQDANASDIAAALQMVLDNARREPMPPHPNQHQTLTIHHADPPKPDPKGAWICVTAAVVGMLIGLAGLYVADEAKDQVTAERLSKEAALQSLKDEHAADMAVIDDQMARVQTYMAAIYAYAPQLKPKDWESFGKIKNQHKGKK